MAVGGGGGREKGEHGAAERLAAPRANGRWEGDRLTRVLVRAAGG